MDENMQSIINYEYLNKDWHVTFFIFRTERDE